VEVEVRNQTTTLRGLLQHVTVSPVMIECRVRHGSVLVIGTVRVRYMLVEHLGRTAINPLIKQTM
jgi:hypothetical protein